MYRYEVQFLGRSEGDYARHLTAAQSIAVTGGMAFRTYYFAGIRGLIVLLENEQDRDALMHAVPRAEIVGAWPIGAAVKQAA